MWRLHRPGSDAIAAVLTWVIGLAAAVGLVHVLDLNPLTMVGAVMPIAVGAVVAGGFIVLCLRRPFSSVLVGTATGAYAAWIGLTMSSALHGTPFGYGGVSGDDGIVASQAMKYMSSWRAVDALVHNIPTEYPPLYPWTVGHIAAAVHRPAWTLLGDAQIVMLSGTLVLSYVLWRRIVSRWASFLIVALGPVIPYDAHAGDWGKVYEVAVLLVIAPWIVATFTGLARNRGGLHWLPAGIIGGLIVLTYSAYFAYALVGVVAIVVLAWRSAASRRAYVLHIVGVAITALVVASWYVLPYVAALLTKPGDELSDLYRSPAIVDKPITLPFLEFTPIGMLMLVGLFGLVWYRQRETWAQPLLLLVVSTYVFRMFFMLQLVRNNHTYYIEYTDRLTSALLVAAGAITVTTVVPRLLGRLPAGHARRSFESSALGMIVVVAYAASQAWVLLVPGPRGLIDVKTPPGSDNYATIAQTTLLPNGAPTRFAPTGMPTIGGFPTSRVERIVRSTMGPGARPNVLSYSERLFAFTPYYCYLPVVPIAANTLQQWRARAATLHRLAQISNPAEFAAASDNLQFGRIDVYVLRDHGGAWTWLATAGLVGEDQIGLALSFSPRAFASPYFRVFHLPNDVVVAVRSPS